MAHDREIAGIRCSEVLGKLEEFVAGELAPDAADQIVCHLKGCDWCERFGGEYVGLIKTLRVKFKADEDVAETEVESLLSKLNFRA